MRQYLAALTLIVGLIIGLISSTVVIAGLSQSKPSAYDLLMQMEQNAKQLTYTGTIVYSQGGRMETLKIFHTLDNGTRRGRLIHLSGEPREIIRKGERLVCATPSTGVFQLSKQIPAGPFSRSYSAQFSGKNKPYTLEYNGEVRVAGRPALLVSLHPVDHYRYGFKLALDKDSKLLLRSLMIDKRGRVLERVEYTSFRVGGKINDSQLEPTILPEQQKQALSLLLNKTATASMTDTTELLWNIGFVPQGFKLVQPRNRLNAHNGQIHNGKFLNETALSEKTHSNVSKTAASTSAAKSLMYTDGLTAYSVFVADKVNLGSHSRHNGATSAFTAVNEDSRGVYSVTVVGEIPLAGAAKIARKVKRAAP